MGTVRAYGDTLGQALISRLPALGKLRPGRFVIALVAGAVFTLVAMYAFNGYWTATLAAGIAFAVTFLSFTISTGNGGILCLGQAGIAAMGAIVAGRLATDAGLGLPLSLIIAVLCAAVCGVVLGAVGTRLDQVGFALVTLAFALFWHQLMTYSTCLGQANSVAATQACQDQFTNTINSRISVLQSGR